MPHTLLPCGWTGRRRLAAAAACALIPVLLASAGCQRKSSNQLTSYEAARTQPQLLSVTAQQLQHLRITQVQPTTLAQVLHLPGTVVYNGQHTTPVIAPIGGPVSRLVVQPGDWVRPGQPLLYVRSPDYNALRDTYLKARDSADLANKTLARSRDLYQHHAIATRDLEAAQSAATQAQADLEAAEQSLRILGLNPAQATRTATPEIPLRAPIAGQVVDRLVAPGQLLQAGTTQCFTISDMSSVWVLVNVFEAQSGAVRVGEPVSIESDAFPGSIQGRIQYVAASFDPTTRTLQARVVVPNPGQRLKNNMYVTVDLQTAALRNALTVPDAAVLRDSENEPFVYRVSGDNQKPQFARQNVRIGASQGGVTQILAGLAPGDRVVGDGGLFLQFASSLQR